MAGLWRCDEHERMMKLSSLQMCHQFQGSDQIQFHVLVLMYEYLLVKKVPLTIEILSGGVLD